MFVLPSQLPQRGGHMNSPEMHLAAAILEDAVHCVVRNADAGTGGLRKTRFADARRGKRWYEFMEARDWLMDDRRDWPFAFANICELLSIDIDAVRESLRHILLAEQHTKQDRSRDEPQGEAQGWNPPGKEQQLPGNDSSSDRERFEVVVWDEV
jgi:hypothetical protein